VQHPASRRSPATGVQSRVDRQAEGRPLSGPRAWPRPPPRSAAVARHDEGRVAHHSFTAGAIASTPAARRLASAHHAQDLGARSLAGQRLVGLAEQPCVLESRSPPGWRGLQQRQFLVAEGAARSAPPDHTDAHAFLASARRPPSGIHELAMRRITAGMSGAWSTSAYCTTRRSVIARPGADPATGRGRAPASVWRAPFADIGPHVQPILLRPPAARRARHHRTAACSCRGSCRKTGCGVGPPEPLITRRNVGRAFCCLPAPPFVSLKQAHVLRIRHHRLGAGSLQNQAR